MAGEKRTWVRQVFMKRSFICSRTTAIFDCWLDPPAGACSGFWETTPTPERLASWLLVHGVCVKQGQLAESR